VPVWQQQRVLEEDAFGKLYESRIPYFMDFESAIEAMSLVAAAGTDTMDRGLAADSHPPSQQDGPAPTFPEVLDRLSNAGVPIATLRLVQDDSGAAVLASLGAPVALKVSHPRLLHKSDAKLVTFPITTASELDA